jgi:hypothetical protein
MSLHYAVPHLFRFGDNRPAAPVAVVSTEVEPDERELYGEEEGIRVLYQRAFLEDE